MGLKATYTFSYTKELDQEDHDDCSSAEELAESLQHEETQALESEGYSAVSVKVTVTGWEDQEEEEEEAEDENEEEEEEAKEEPQKK